MIIWVGVTGREYLQARKFEEMGYLTLGLCWHLLTQNLCLYQRQACLRAVVRGWCEQSASCKTAVGT